MKNVNLKESRRSFLKIAIPAGGMLCMGCSNLFGSNIAPPNEQELDFEKRIQTELSIKHIELYKLKYKYYVQRMEKFAEYMGRDNLISMLKRAVDDINLTNKPNLEAKSVKDFINPVLESKSFKILLDLEVTELTDNSCRVKVTNCLYAKVFRAMNAGDIGYANTCYGDFSGATAYNPKLKLERTKTLMEGHDCCDGRYTWDS